MLYMVRQQVSIVKPVFSISTLAAFVVGLRQMIRFGEAIDVGNINGDIFEDIVIGVPGETVGWGSRTKYEAEGLHIVYGSQTGITGYESDWLYQNAPNWPGRSEK